MGKSGEPFRIVLRQTVKPTEFRYSEGLSSQRVRTSRTITLASRNNALGPDLTQKADIALSSKLMLDASPSRSRRPLEPVSP